MKEYKKGYNRRNIHFTTRINDPKFQVEFLKFLITVSKEFNLIASRKNFLERKINVSVASHKIWINQIKKEYPNLISKTTKGENDGNTIQ